MTKYKPGGLRRSHDSCEHLFGLPWSSNGSLILASVLGGGRLRQAEGEGGTFAGRQDWEFAGVDGGRRGLGKRHLRAPFLAFVLHCCLLKWSSAQLMCRTSWNNKGRKCETSSLPPPEKRALWRIQTEPNLVLQPRILHSAKKRAFSNAFISLTAAFPNNCLRNIYVNSIRATTLWS